MIESILIFVVLLTLSRYFVDARPDPQNLIQGLGQGLGSAFGKLHVWIYFWDFSFQIKLSKIQMEVENLFRFFFIAGAAAGSFARETLGTVVCLF